MPTGIFIVQTHADFFHGRVQSSLIHRDSRQHKNLRALRCFPHSRMLHASTCIAGIDIIAAAPPYIASGSPTSLCPVVMCALLHMAGMARQTACSFMYAVHVQRGCGTSESSERGIQSLYITYLTISTTSISSSSLPAASFLHVSSFKSVSRLMLRKSLVAFQF